MNDRLEIASRLIAAVRAAGHSMPTADALWEADALIEEEARSRPPAADASGEPQAAPKELVDAATLLLHAWDENWDEYDSLARKLGCTESEPTEWGGGYCRDIILRARTRPNSSISSNSSPAPDDMRVVAEDMLVALRLSDAALNNRVSDREAIAMAHGYKPGHGSIWQYCHDLREDVIARARAIGLGGGR